MMIRESVKPVIKCDVNCYDSETIPSIEQITSYITNHQESRLQITIKKNHNNRNPNNSPSYLLFQCEYKKPSYDPVHLHFLCLKTHILCRNIFFLKYFLLLFFEKIMHFCSCLPTLSSLSSSVMVLFLFLTNNMFFPFTICQFLVNLQYFCSTSHVTAFFFLLYCWQSLLSGTQIPSCTWKSNSNTVLLYLILIKTHLPTAGSLYWVFCYSRHWKTEDCRWDFHQLKNSKA